jgi:hypothetical protein
MVPGGVASWRKEPAMRRMERSKLALGAAIYLAAAAELWRHFL